MLAATFNVHGRCYVMILNDVVFQTLEVKNYGALVLNNKINKSW